MHSDLGLYLRGHFWDQLHTGFVPEIRFGVTEEGLDAWIAANDESLGVDNEDGIVKPGQ